MDNSLPNTNETKMSLHVQKDYDQFLQSFEQPTQLYRMLRARHKESPIFLNRNLSYMQRTELKNRISLRKDLNKILDICQNNDYSSIVQTPNTILSIEFIDLSYAGLNCPPKAYIGSWRINLSIKKFNNSFEYTQVGKFESLSNENDKIEISSNIFEGSSPENVLLTSMVVSIESSNLQGPNFTKARREKSDQIHKELIQNKSPPVAQFTRKQTSLKLKPISPDLQRSPNSKTMQKSAINDPNSPSLAKTDKKIGFQTTDYHVKNSPTIKNLTNSPLKVNKLSIRPLKIKNNSHSLRNLSRKNYSDNKHRKRRKLKVSSKMPEIFVNEIENSLKMTSLASIRNKIELDLFDRLNNECALKNGEYKIEFTISKNSAHQGKVLSVKFQNIEEVNPQIENEDYQTLCLTFKLTWFPNPPLLAHLTLQNSLLRKAILTFKLSLKAANNLTNKISKNKQSTCKNSQNCFSSPALYNFIYGSNCFQQTQVTRKLECPFCYLTCLKIYGLMQHLNSTHPRLTFTLSTSDSFPIIDVTRNKNYDESFEGDPKELCTNRGVALWRMGPVKRKRYSTIIFFKAKKVTREENINKFMKNSDVQPSNSNETYLGLDRVFFHSKTCQPILPEELDIDSEDDDFDFTISHMKKQINEFTDVNQDEKEIIKLWNVHVIQSKVVGDCHILHACNTFVDKYGDLIREKNLVNNFLVHLIQLSDQGLLQPDSIVKLMSLVHKDEN